MDFLLVRLGYRCSQMLNVSGRTGHSTAQVDASLLKIQKYGKKLQRTMANGISIRQKDLDHNIDASTIK